MWLIAQRAADAFAAIHGRLPGQPPEEAFPEAVDTAAAAAAAAEGGDGEGNCSTEEANADEDEDEDDDAVGFLGRRVWWRAQSRAEYSGAE